MLKARKSGANSGRYTSRQAVRQVVKRLYRFAVVLLSERQHFTREFHKGGEMAGYDRAAGSPFHSPLRKHQECQNR